MSPRGRRLAVAAAVVAVALVAGFLWLRGSGDDDPFASYCSEVESRREQVGAALSAGPEVGLIRALPSFEALAEKSPDDIRADWQLVVARITDLEKALSAAGVDAATYDREDPPTSVSAEDRQAIDTAAVRLGSRETAAALSRVQQQARDVCKTPLSL